MEAPGFRKGRVIGTGGFSQIHKGTLMEDGQRVALKVVDRRSPKDVEKARREFDVMRSYGRHPNLLRCFGASEADPEFLTLILELGKRDLCDLVMATGPVPASIAQQYTLMLVRGLRHLHSKGWAHRDLKPDNILCMGDGRLCIADFGLANRTSIPSTLLETPCGTESYAAPEVIARTPYDGASADVFSLGIVLHVMLVGSYPWERAAHDSTLFCEHKAGRFRWSPDLPQGCFTSLLQGMLAVDPASRMKLEEVEAHPWVAAAASKVPVGAIGEQTAQAVAKQLQEHEHPQQQEQQQQQQQQQQNEEKVEQQSEQSAPCTAVRGGAAVEAEAGPQHAPRTEPASPTGHNMRTEAISMPQPHPQRAQYSENRKRYVVEPHGATESCVPDAEEAWRLVDPGPEAQTIQGEASTAAMGVLLITLMLGAACCTAAAEIGVGQVGVPLPTALGYTHLSTAFLGWTLALAGIVPFIVSVCHLFMITNRNNASVIKAMGKRQRRHSDVLDAMV